MKRKVLYFFSLTIIVLLMSVVSTISFDNGSYTVYANAFGSPGAKTNSPGDGGGNCTNCHSGTLNPGSAIVSITSAGLVSGYVPGQTYTINAGVTGTSSSKIGFEVTAERDANNAKIGTIVITDGSRTKLVNANNAVTHNSGAGTAAVSGSNAWTFDWTAPVAGSGNVTFYGSFNVTNSSNNTFGDQVYTATFLVNENVSVGLNEVTIASKLKLYPNPAVSHFNIEASSFLEKIEIFNLSGQKILDQKFSLNKIDIQNLEAGIYIVKIYAGDELIIKKLIKE